MVGIVIVSHSSKIAEGLIELSRQMAPNVPMASAGGTLDGRIGTDIEKIISSINEVYSKDGVLIIFDLGSALMNAEMAIEYLDSEIQKKVSIVDAAIVEGTITAAIQSSIGNNLEQIKKALIHVGLNKLQ
ncbi:dihydroxyacetone kinase phosphoryl donor subunit DhaM [Clostridium sediminicola]|uniref:dihydroxyacetone kinase phosphoryl donor subunit DhaM n=1 Tax=Clostridium sediminicola TaxID=3114879 RepID=UPI0031F2348C